MARRVVGLDLDGVLWRGVHPIEGSAGAVAALREAGVAVAFLTNNANPTLGDYVAKMADVGIEAAPEEFVTSAQAAAELLSRALTAGDRVHVCGGPGLVEAVAARGLEVVGDGPAAAVVVGYDPGFDYDTLARAAEAARAGARFVATNVDATFPSGDLLLPGNGALVAAVATAAGVQPEVAGKPEAPYADLVRERLGRHGVMVGDRPSTDGALAEVLGWPFALVLSGVAGSDDGEPVPDPAPPFVADDLASLVPQLLDDPGAAT